jgi:hypothetical protein
MGKKLAATRGVPILPRKVEVASRMERRDTFALAAAMGAHMRPRKEEFAPHMAPRRNVAATKGAPVSPGKVEFASHMAPHRNVAVTRVAQIEPLGAEFVAHMVQSVTLHTRGVHQIFLTGRTLQEASHKISRHFPGQSETPPQPTEGFEATTAGVNARRDREIGVKNLQTNIISAASHQSPSPRPSATPQDSSDDEELGAWIYKNCHRLKET